MMILSLVVLAIAAAPEPPAPGVDLARLARLIAAPGIDSKPAPEPVSEMADYAVESAARGTLVYVLPAGPRTVRALEVVPNPATASGWWSAHVRLTWESDDPAPTLAGVDLPLTLAFGRSEGLRVSGKPVASWVIRLPMPYHTRALLRIDTESPLAGRIRVRTTRGIDSDAGYLRGAVWETLKPLTSSGRGHLVGINLNLGLTAPGRLCARLVLDENEVRPFPGALLGVPNSNDPVEGASWRLDAPIRFHEGFAIEPVEPRHGVDPAPLKTKGAIYWYSEHPRDDHGGR